MFHGWGVLQVKDDIEKPCNFAKSVNFVVANTKKSLKFGHYLWKTTFNHKTRDLFKVLNIEIS